MDKEAFRYILEEIYANLRKGCRSTVLSPVTKLATFLRFLGTGNYQIGVGNEYVSSISQSKVSEVIEECLVAFEDTLCEKWIRLHMTSDEEMECKMHFHSKFGFPGVVGCVDGTHVKILGPKEELRHVYYNRKGFYSINAMLVCY